MTAMTVFFSAEPDTGSKIRTGRAGPDLGLGLDQLPAREWATVIELRPGDSPEDRNLALRLTEIGFVPGEAVHIVAHGMPGREPIAVRIGRTTFALRRHEAAIVRVAAGRAGRAGPAGAAHHG